MQPLWKTVWIWKRVCQLLNMRLSYSPATILQGIYPRKNENLCSQKNLYINVHSSLSCNSKRERKRGNPHVLQGVKLWNIHIMEYYSAIKRSKLLVRQKKKKKTVWRVLKNFRIELPYDPTIPLLGIYPKNMKTLI